MRVPLTVYGTKEVVLFGGGSLVLLAVLVGLGVPYVYFAPIPGFVLLFTLYFFRDPTRQIPTGDEVVVSPADGKIVAIENVDHEEFLDGPGVRIDIFLAVTDVHVNRAPLSGEVVWLADRKGSWYSATKAEAGEKNRAKLIGFKAKSGTFPFLVRQIVGSIARRIVCAAETGTHYEKGDRIGMIKFGSRTQLSLPAEAGFEPTVKVGDRVRGGATVLGTVRKGAAG